MDSNEKKHSETAPARTRAKASTQAILGAPERRPVIQPRWARHYKHLKELRDQILAKKETLAQDVRANGRTPLFGEHLADAATDSYDRDWALSLLSSEQNALYEIDAAIDRVARGTYGQCELTGEPIEADRLHAIPWTRFCAAAQKELEAKGTMGRTQLGALRSHYETEDTSEASEDDLEVSQATAEKERR